MLQVFYGTDTVVVRREALAAIDALTAKGYTLARYSAEEYAPGLIPNLLQADSLFGTKEVVLFDTPSDDPDFYDAVSALAPDLQVSVVPFVVIETAVLAPQLRVFTNAGAVVHEAKKAVAGRFNTFAMADALLTRDKKSLWILLQEARRAEVASEEIIGILWWQLKTLRLTYVAPTASAAGLKDFPYNKAKRAQSKFNQSEIDSLSRSLLVIYHDGHAGRYDLSSALEAWVLRL